MYDRVEARQAKLRGTQEPWRLKWWHFALALVVVGGILFGLSFVV